MPELLTRNGNIQLEVVYVSVNLVCFWSVIKLSTKVNTGPRGHSQTLNKSLAVHHGLGLRCGDDGIGKGETRPVSSRGNDAKLSRFILVRRNAERLEFWASDALIVIFHIRSKQSRGSSQQRWRFQQDPLPLRIVGASMARGRPLASTGPVDGAPSELSSAPLPGARDEAGHIRHGRQGIFPKQGIPS